MQGLIDKWFNTTLHCYQCLWKYNSFEYHVVLFHEYFDQRYILPISSAWDMCCFTGQLVYCNDAEGLLHIMGLPAHDSSEWRLYIDSSKRSLKCLLLHNRNIYGQILIVLSKNENKIRWQQDCSGVVAILCSWMGNLCWFENGELSAGSTRRLHKIPLFPVLLGQ